MIASAPDLASVAPVCFLAALVAVAASVRLDADAGASAGPAGGLVVAERVLVTLSVVAGRVPVIVMRVSSWVDGGGVVPSKVAWAIGFEASGSFPCQRECRSGSMSTVDPQARARTGRRQSVAPVPLPAVVAQKSVIGRTNTDDKGSNMPASPAMLTGGVAPDIAARAVAQTTTGPMLHVGGVALPGPAIGMPLPLRVPGLGRAASAFVSDVTKMPDLPADRQPVRVAVGVRSAPSVEERVELAMQELERTGAFRKGTIVVASPSGTGYVNLTMAETVERMLGGDSAIVSVAYSERPSILSVHRTPIGGRTQALLMRRIKERIDELYPGGNGPVVRVYGESLGAWTSQTAFGMGWAASRSQFGVDSVLWLGTPGMSSWRATREPAVARELWDRAGIQALTDAQRGATRITSFANPDDHITRFELQSLWRRPEWMREDGRYPEHAIDDGPWIPIVTGVRSLIATARSAHVAAGRFEAGGHDYRRDMPDLVALWLGRPRLAEAESAEWVVRLQRSAIERERRLGMT